VNATIEHLREAMLALHPVTLERGGLEQALGAVARQAARQGGFELSADVDPDVPGGELVLAVARELLANAARHSGASQVGLLIARDGDGVVVEVADDGSGMDPERRREALSEGHIGLASVAQRVEAAGGTFTLETGPGEGTTARASLPG
jgi:two-component system NarL family sensor kinase